MFTSKDSISELSSDDKIRAIEKSIVNHLIYLLGKDPVETHQRDWFEALARVVRDLLTTQWMESMRSYYLQDAKRVYYLSMEFLMGRALGNALRNMQCSNEFRHALEEMGLRLEDISQCEAEAGLAMEVSDDWRPAFWIHWPVWICQDLATVSVMSLACLPSRSIRAGR